MYLAQAGAYTELYRNMEGNASGWAAAQRMTVHGKAERGVTVTSKKNSAPNGTFWERMLKRYSVEFWISVTAFILSIMAFLMKVFAR